MGRGWSNRDNPLGAPGESAQPGESLAAGAAADFVWPPPDDLLDRNVVRFNAPIPLEPPLEQNDVAVANRSPDEGTDRAAPAIAFVATPPRSEETLSAAGGAAVAPPSNLTAAAPQLAAPAAAAHRVTNWQRHRTWKRVWVAAVRSPDVIVAVAALILTVLSGITIRFGMIESVAAMALPLLNPPAVAPEAPRAPVLQSVSVPSQPSPNALQSRSTNTAAARTSSEIPVRVAPPRGRLVISSQPVGADIIINGRSHGRTPRTIGVAPGEYALVLRRGEAQVRQTVVVAGGATVSVVAPFQPSSVAAGWLSVASKVDLDIFERGLLVGSSRTPRILLEAGPHTLEFVNEETAFRASQEVRIQSGTAERIDIALPVSSIHVNAVPWAEVWIDGTLVGQTPLGNHPIAIGPHRIVFRHPLLGERAFETVVKAGTPTRLTARFTTAEP